MIESVMLSTAIAGPTEKKIKPRRRKNTVIGRRRDLAMVNLLSFKLLNAKIH